MAINIRSLPEGEKIREPGVYSLSINRYHSDCADAPSFSSGDLVAISQSGEEFWDQSYYNPDSSYFDKADRAKHKPHFHFGNAAHGKIIGHEDGEDWFKDYILMPPEYKGKYTTNAAKDWRVVQERQGFTCITEGDILKVDAMAERILADPTASELFQYGQPELSLFVKFEDIWIKSRPDVIPIYDQTIINDYKTTYDNSLSSVKREIGKWHYDQKLANVAWSMYQLPEFEMPEFHELAFSLLFQKSSRPYGITPFEIPNSYVWQLAHLNIKAAQEAAHGMRTGQWRGYTDKIEVYNPNQWKVNDIENRIASGELPTVDNMMKLVTKET